MPIYTWILSSCSNIPFPPPFTQHSFAASVISCDYITAYTLILNPSTISWLVCFSHTFIH